MELMRVVTPTGQPWVSDQGLPVRAFSWAPESFQAAQRQLGGIIAALPPEVAALLPAGRIAIGRLPEYHRGAVISGAQVAGHAMIVVHEGWGVQPTGEARDILLHELGHWLLRNAGQKAAGGHTAAFFALAWALMLRAGIKVYIDDSYFFGMGGVIPVGDWRPVLADARELADSPDFSGGVAKFISLAGKEAADREGRAAYWVLGGWFSVLAALGMAANWR